MTLNSIETITASATYLKGQSRWTRNWLDSGSNFDETQKPIDARAMARNTERLPLRQ